MAGALVHVGALAMCPHAGQVSVISSNTRVLLGGQRAATASDNFTIAGCAFTVGSKPQPCVTVRWSPAGRVKIGGQPAVLQTSVGLCKSAEQIDGGPANVGVVQSRVKGT